MCGIDARTHHIGAVRSTRRMASHASVEISATVESRASPPAALLTSTLSPPRRSAASSTSAVHARSSRRSAGTKCAIPPASVTCCTTASPRSRLRPVTTTAAPWAANASAIARPMPAVDPVTSARSPCMRTRRTLPGALALVRTTVPRPKRARAWMIRGGAHPCFGSRRSLSWRPGQRRRISTFDVEPLDDAPGLPPRGHRRAREPTRRGW